MAWPTTRKAGIIAAATIPLWLFLAWASYAGIGADIPCSGSGCGLAPFLIGFVLVVFMVAFIAAAIVSGILALTLVVLPGKARQAKEPAPGTWRDDQFEYRKLPNGQVQRRRR